MREPVGNPIQVLKLVFFAFPLLLAYPYMKDWPPGWRWVPFTYVFTFSARFVADFLFGVTSPKEVNDYGRTRLVSPPCETFFDLATLVTFMFILAHVKYVPMLYAPPLQP